MAKVTSFIARMEKQFGPDWIGSLTPEKIQKNSSRNIFKDIILGIIDYEAHGKYFLNDGKLIENLIIAARNELEVNTLYLNAVSFYAQYNPGYTEINAQISHLQALCYIYSIILERLNMVKFSGNIGYMVDVSGLLYQYRKHII